MSEKGKGLEDIDEEKALELIQAIESKEILVRIFRLLEEQKVEGIVEASSYTVTQTIISPLRIRPSLPHKKWFSVVIYNDGPNVVYRSVNSSSKPLSLNKNDMSIIDMEHHGIEELAFWVDAGSTASIRIDTKL